MRRALATTDVRLREEHGDVVVTLFAVRSIFRLLPFAEARQRRRRAARHDEAGLLLIFGGRIIFIRIEYTIRFLPHSHRIAFHNQNTNDDDLDVIPQRRIAEQNRHLHRKRNGISTKKTATCTRRVTNAHVPSLIPLALNNILPYHIHDCRQILDESPAVKRRHRLVGDDEHFDEVLHRLRSSSTTRQCVDGTSDVIRQRAFFFSRNRKQE